MHELQVRVQQAPKPTAPSGFREAWVEAQKHSFPPRGLEAGAGKVPGKTAGRSRWLESPPHQPSSSASRGHRGTAHRLHRRIDHAEGALAWSKGLQPLSCQVTAGGAEGSSQHPAVRHLPSTQLSPPQRHLPPSTPPTPVEAQEGGKFFSFFNFHPRVSSQ